MNYRFITNNHILPLMLEDKDEQFIPVMTPYWKIYPPVYLYYLKSTGKANRVKALIDFLIMKTK